MNHPRLAPLLLLAGMISLASAQQPAAATWPFEPAQLLATLPTAPENWTLTESAANTELGASLFTTATRVFHAPPAPSTATPPPPGEVQISVVDTAGFASFLAEFANFAPVKSGTFEKKFIGALPAIVTTDEQGRKFTQVLVSSRYLVEITLTNLPNQRPEDWLRAFHFDTLPPTNPAPTTRPNQFRLSKLDELHPERNRSYFVSTSDSKAVDSFLKKLPPEALEPAKVP